MANTIAGLINSTTPRDISIDGSTHAVTCIDYEHHEIHNGSHYYIEGVTTLADGAEFDICAQTADVDKWIHLVWNYAGTGIVEFSVYEDPDITFDGTDITAINNDRNSANTSNLVNLESGSTVTTLGTLISQTRTGDASNPAKPIGGGFERGRELILKQDTTYLWRFRSGTNSNAVTYQGEWYEHTNKD